MPRKNFGVRLGRPPATAASKMGPLGRMSSAATDMPLQAPAPSDAFSPGIPAKAFRGGGKVGGYSCMPRHHDDPKFCGGGKVK